MNELVRVENGEVKLDSRMIADHFKKNHKDVMRDIRDEIEKLETAGMGDERIFAPTEYPDSMNRMQPAFEMNEEGAMQLAARYDAAARRQLILKIKELKQSMAPKTPAEMLLQSVQQLVEHEKKLNALDGKVEAIKETIVHEPDHWREDISNMLNRVAKAIGPDFHRRVRSDSYKTLEGKARVDLNRRLENIKRRMAAEGASMTRIKGVNKLDVIEADPKLREIYTGIVRTLVIKHCT